jgi:radical SAM superfamily enzyme YgiQ (UPF0313 family)
MCNSRADCLDPELARAMRAAGCVGISFGLESGVQEILDRVEKGTTIEQGRAAVRAAKDAGIMTLGHFILGLPGETRETIRRTVAYAIDVDPDWAQFYCATPLPGTALRAQAEREGMIAGHQLERSRVPAAEHGDDDVERREDLERRAAARISRRSMRGPQRPQRRLGARLRLRDIGKLGRQAASFVGSWVLDA